MKKILKYTFFLLAAAVLGIGSAVWAVNSHIERTWLQNGAWRVNLAIGSKETDLYSKAAVSLGGLFALNKSETIYFVAGMDDDGHRLKADCDYSIQGGEPASRWWSITLYGEDYFLVPNPEKRYSYDAKSLKRSEDGRYTISVSRTPKDGNWLPSGDKDQKIYLTLRLYNPDRSIYEHPDRVELPRIIKEGCQ